jgi:hypothetical protein
MIRLHYRAQTNDAHTDCDMFTLQHLDQRMAQRGSKRTTEKEQQQKEEMESNQEAAPRAAAEDDSNTPIASRDREPTERAPTQAAFGYCSGGENVDPPPQFRSTRTKIVCVPVRCKRSRWSRAAGKVKCGDGGLAMQLHSESGIARKLTCSCAALAAARRRAAGGLAKAAFCVKWRRYINTWEGHEQQSRDMPRDHDRPKKEEDKPNKLQDGW